VSKKSFLWAHYFPVPPACPTFFFAKPANPNLCSILEKRTRAQGSPLRESRRGIFRGPATRDCVAPSGVFSPGSEMNRKHLFFPPGQTHEPCKFPPIFCQERTHPAMAKLRWPDGFGNVPPAIHTAPVGPWDFFTMIPGADPRERED